MNLKICIFRPLDKFGTSGHKKNDQVYCNKPDRPNKHATYFLSLTDYSMLNAEVQVIEKMEEI